MLLTLFVPRCRVSTPRRRHTVPVCIEQTYATTASGLRWVDVEVGTAEVAEAGDAVVVQYSGALISGADRSVGAGGLVATWAVDERQAMFAIGSGRGGMWEECTEGMRVGGKRRVLVPPSATLRPLKKGQRDTIPTGETARFDCELVGIERGLVGLSVRPAWSDPSSRQRQSWPPMARGALALAHGGPLGIRAESWLLGPRSAALEPLRGAAKVVGVTACLTLSALTIQVRAGLLGEGSFFAPLLFVVLVNALLWGVYYPWLLTQPVSESTGPLWPLL